ncbi:outer membrane lipoprotein SlyB [Rhodobium orientis]|uniref:Glycine zipper domain-containing protein n=1 Tax=Rhodobium orientis TaxID=34017 RepID=A0A327JKP0_9HYPH|nr:glycine zipper domain-containing protein [Rhodobium orientis]MBB4301333.1 outer membrane lipoprotein SlyB [Rhodobium orientis]MBK5951079.1 hypothetical protein [Rhodobium orientis]RAI26857.1 hypothetical protein CH339_12525 [Rhodobium orientis]
MKKVILPALAALMIAGCTTTEQGAVVGGASGAAIGAATSGTMGGAVAGGAIGAVAGGLIGRAAEPGWCYYRDRYGRRYRARCDY